MESLQLTGPAGKLAAELLLPASFDRQTQRCDLVILMHGFLGGRAKQPMTYHSRILTEAGHAVLRFDFDGYGDSDGPSTANTVPKMIDDAQAVWRYARTLPFVRRIILLGHSQGGVVAGMLAGRLAAAGTPPAGLILLAPASILREFAQRGRFFTVRCNPADPPATINIYGFKMGRDYITSAQTLPIEQESARYSGPVCLLHGTWDGIIPIACSEWYHQLYPRSEFHRIRCTGHVFLLRRKLLRSHVLDFLRNLPAPRATDNDAS